MASPRRAPGGAPAPVAPLEAAFYARPVVEVARDMLGCIVRHGSTAGVIVETEAYHDSEAACHAHVGVTPRTHILFGPPGRAYVYRSYGIHALLNAVCEDEGTGAAVLIRALEPLQGLELMRARRIGAILLGGLAALAIVDAVGFFVSLARGSIQTPAVVPASLAVAVCLGALAAELHVEPLPRALGPRWTVRRAIFCAATCAVVAVALPLVRMITFGPTRYERRADCAVVFGARVWDDGTPSLALADRVDEAIRLYHRGAVRKLVMSGAVEPNGRSEPDVMRARAEEAGVPREDILLDEAGVDTGATVRNTARLMREERLRSALAVSHYYHEPRVKMLFDRAGVRVHTVPARMTRRLVKEPYFLLREVAAFYHSFLLE